VDPFENDVEDDEKSGMISTSGGSDANKPAWQTSGEEEVRQAKQLGRRSVIGGVTCSSSRFSAELIAGIK
jgi:hypothetical protein